MLTRCFLASAMLLGMVLPSYAQSDPTALEKAVQNIESAIQESMNRAGQQGQPTLGQLGGVQSGSTGSDAGGGAGGSGASGSSGGSSGGAGGPGGGQSE